MAHQSVEWLGRDGCIPAPLLSTITVFEFLSAGLLHDSERVRPNESFLTIAAGYLAIYALMLLASRAVEKWLGGSRAMVKG